MELQGQLLPGLSLVLAGDLPVVTFPGNLGEVHSLHQALFPADLDFLPVAVTAAVTSQQKVVGSPVAKGVFACSWRGRFCQRLRILRRAINPMSCALCMAPSLRVRRVAPQELAPQSLAPQ